MSDSGSEQSSGEDPPSASADEAPRDETPPATPQAQRSPAGRSRKVLLMSPAWIKQKSTPSTLVGTIGYDCDKIAPHSDIVLFSIPAGAKLEDLHGKQLMLPEQAGARTDIEGYRFEAVRGPDESTKDLHLLSTVDGVANCKPVSSVYSLQMRLADVPADEEPIDESVLQTIQEALGAGQNGINGHLLSNKKKKSKHGRSSRLTGNPQEHDGPQVSEPRQAAAPTEPPATDGNEEVPEKMAAEGGKQKKQRRGSSDEQPGVDGDDVGEDSSKKPKKKKKKKKKKREEASADIEEPAEASFEQLAGAVKEEPAETPEQETPGAAGALDEAGDMEDAGELDESGGFGDGEAEEAPEEEDAEQEAAEEEEEAAQCEEAAEEEASMEEAPAVADEDAVEDAAAEAALEAEPEEIEAVRPKKKRKRPKSAAGALGLHEGDQERGEKPKKKKKKKRAESMGTLEVPAPPTKKKKKGKRRSEDDAE